MAQTYLIFSSENFINFVLSDATAQALGLPIVDPETDEPVTYTIQTAFARVLMRSGRSTPIKLTEGVGYISDVDPSDATHWLCPVNNMTVEMDDLLKPLAQLEGKNWRHVKLTIPQVYHLRESGEFPPVE